MTKFAPEWVRTSDPVIRSPARYRWTTAPAIIAFDNNQVLQRRWRVKLNNQVHCNIVTVVVCFNLDQQGRIPYDTSMNHRPSEWMYRNLTEEEEIFAKYIDKDDDIKDLHYRHVTQFLQQELDIVAKEQKKKDDVYVDSVDTNLQTQKYATLYKRCYNCPFTQIPKKKHNCPQCKANVTKSKLQSMGLLAIHWRLVGFKEYQRRCVL